MPKPSLIEILTCLHEFFPQAFVLEQHLSHRPLKVGIDGDLAERCPALDRRERAAVLRLYVSRVCTCKPVLQAPPASISTATRPAK
jgi:sRNA-binding protein